MTRRRTHTERADDDKAGEVIPANAASKSPMERFKSMTRRLIRVPYAELEEQRRIFENEKDKHRRNRRESS
jgi:hypothetical protein